MFIELIVIFSYFHPRKGTSIFYSFPETPLGKEISERLYDIMTQQYEEEFFIHSYENFKILNYYFQIPSEWARGKREMVMISVILNQQISSEIEENIAVLCKKFSEKLQSNKNVYTGFYTYELNKHDEMEKERIIKNEGLIKKSVQDLYWEIKEEIRNKIIVNTEEPFEVEDENEDKSDYEFSKPFPPIPPSSPGSVGSAKQKVQLVIKQEESYLEPYCKYCGAELPKGESICHACGMKVI
ncbi:MAG: zinc ribbon domain-containing protein [Candidatus Thorarchaeota archaeon]